MPDKTKPTSWANRTKTAANVVPISKQASKTERGTRHEGAVEIFELTSYSTGSYGYKIAYSVTGLERKVYENVVLKTMSKDGTLSPTKYGESTLKRRLAAFGLDADAINQFHIPQSPKDIAEGEAVSFAGAPVALYLTDEEYLGKPQKRVKAVFPIDDQN